MKLQDNGFELGRNILVNKLLELGLIMDRSELKNNNASGRSKSRNKETEIPQGSRRGTFEYENIPIEDLEIVLSRFKWNDNVEKALKWLRLELEDEIKDRQESPESEWVERILLAQDETVLKYLEKSNFKSILRSAQFQYPNHEQVYWRIGKLFL